LHLAICVADAEEASMLPMPGNGAHLRHAEDVSAGRHLLAVVAVAALLVGGIVSVEPTAQAASAGVTTYASVSHGSATRVQRATSALVAPSAQRSGPIGARRLPTAQSASPQSSARGVAPALSAAGLGKVVHNFNGTSSRDSEVTNFNADFEPPDQGLCVGNGYVLEPVNSAYIIYKANGTVVRGPFNVNDLFNEGSEEFTSDPRCYYDAPTHTWFASILFINSTSTASHMDLAVNSSGDPTTLWTQYQINTNDDGVNGQPSHPGCPCFGDQPLLGVDQTNVYLSTNEFSILGPQFNGAQIYAVDKADLVKGKATARFAHFDDLSIGGATAASVQPAITHGSQAAEYFLSSLDPDGTGDNRVGVWAMTNRGVVASGGTPTLTSTVITSEPYAIPPAAKQKGATSKIDSGDDRMQQAQFINGSLWGELGTSVTIAGDATARAGAAWFQVHPKLSGGKISAAALKRQGYVVSPRGYVIYPALQADTAGRAAMVFTLTSTSRYPSAAFATLTAIGATFSAPTVYGAGTGPYDPAATRWGDYSWAVLSPNADAVWIATEYVPPVSSQTATRLRNWGTRTAEVNLT
jgi:hypothetical protein